MKADNSILGLATELVERATAKGVMIATAESCTGGMIASALTDVPGASAIFDRGFVTYSNEAKTELLRVDVEIIQSHGAVSEETARAMAVGALSSSRADIAIATTGIAGPGGGATTKPVGLVWFGIASRNGARRAEKRLYGELDRAAIRRLATETALQLVLEEI